MCGIIGGYSSQSTSKPDYESGLASLAHRGPDDRGLDRWKLASGEVVLGQTRLAIIDLSSSGHQPMHSRCGRYVIVFNGEIYNYRELRSELILLGHTFVSDSDTEVLLASWIAWGDVCLPRLRGMFAFVVFDKTLNTLTCIRDAFGIKPLFYKNDVRGFAFASEVQALLKLDVELPNLNLQSAYDYLVGGNYDHHPDTFYENLWQLMPGHILTFDLGKVDITQHRRWWWPSIEERTDLSFASACVQLREMFLSNIRLHLRSDVPFGAALSGGLDSSAVVCAMRFLDPNIPIHTFSYVARGSDVDEEYWVDLVNNYVQATPHKVVVSSGELSADLDDMICAQGEPFCSTSIYAQFRVFKLARHRGITVTLDGQGADELLAGYRGYPGPRLHSHVDRRQWRQLFSFIRSWSQWPGRSTSFGVKALIAQLLPDRFFTSALKLVGRDPTPSWINVKYLRDQRIRLVCRHSSDEEDAVGRRLVSALRQSLVGHGLNSLLRHGDRNSMFWSIESRVPFLTTDMAEFLLSLPEDFLISPQGQTKYIFREAMRGIVPNEILDRKDKIGFATPEQVWLQQLGSKVLNYLSVADQLPFLNADLCRAEVMSIVSGAKPFNLTAWRLVNYCRWLQLR